MFNEKSKRGECYCSRLEDDATSFEENGIPKGYCGICDICGKQGHIRHFPGPLPYTGSWCDEHYDMMSEAYRHDVRNHPAIYYKTTWYDDNELNETYFKVIGEAAVRFVEVDVEDIHGWEPDDFPATGFEIWMTPVSKWVCDLEEISPEEFGTMWERSTRTQ